VQNYYYKPACAIKNSEMKNLNLLFSFLLTSLSLSAQLKVDSVGRIIVGTMGSNLYESMTIKGNLKLMSTLSNGNNFCYFKINNGVPGLDIGGTNKGVAFFYLGKYLPTYASNHYKVSDSILKFNHFEIQNPLGKLMSLQPYYYNIYTLGENQVANLTSEYGFFSQEVESALTEVNITKDVHDLKVLDYDQIIPLIVAAIKEQQYQIDSLQNLINQCCSSNTERFEAINNTAKNEKSIITNVSPNPNDGKFKIEFNISENVRNSSFEITDANGKQQFFIKLSPNDFYSRTISLNLVDLKPGIYNISLITDGISSDMKKLLIQ